MCPVCRAALYAFADPIHDAILSPRPPDGKCTSAQYKRAQSTYRNPQQLVVAQSQVSDRQDARAEVSGLRAVTAPQKVYKNGGLGTKNKYNKQKAHHWMQTHGPGIENSWGHGSKADRKRGHSA